MTGILLMYCLQGKDWCCWQRWWEWLVFVAGELWWSHRSWQHWARPFPRPLFFTTPPLSPLFCLLVYLTLSFVFFFSFLSSSFAFTILVRLTLLLLSVLVVPSRLLLLLFIFLLHSPPSLFLLPLLYSTQCPLFSPSPPFPFTIFAILFSSACFSFSFFFFSFSLPLIIYFFILTTITSSSSSSSFIPFLSLT